MVIDRQGFTDVIYFSSQPPSYFIEALRGGDVTLQQSESAWEFYQEHKRLMRPKGMYLRNMLSRPLLTGMVLDLSLFRVV
ncbi:hypothetical protein [Sneathiella glossodoripedis]|uniref:hypothetical protein n=1 Tax=Sneathiella glossodoripedis TaxID=418853 RepID=UPI0011DC8E0A|nr:hypothetical protein [Sneathiella glossodoripedis]